MEQEIKTELTEIQPEQDIKQDPVEWYQQITLKDAKVFIQANIASAARGFIAIGYYLKFVRDGGLYAQDGYSSIWNFADAEFGISKSTASRYMTMNDRFSKNGNSPIVAEEYRGFGKSQLQEMLYLTDDQVEQVTPETPVKQIRAARGPEREIPYIEIPGQFNINDFLDTAQEPVVSAGTGTLNLSDFSDSITETVATSQQEEPLVNEFACDNCQHDNGVYCDYPETPDNYCVMGDKKESAAKSQQETEKSLSVYGEPKREYPEGSLLRAPGCGKHTCCFCHIGGCAIRQEESYCVDAPLGNTFSCATLKAFDAIRDDIGEQCQFVNLDLAYHRTGDGEPVPCCKDCKEKCSYACMRSVKELDTEAQEMVIDGNFTEVGELARYPYTMLDISDEIASLEEYQELAKTDETFKETAAFKKAKMRHDAMLLLKERLEMNDITEELEIEPEPEMVQQPELSILKNNDQRGAFVDVYDTWPVWIDTPETGERYYRYNLPDDSSMVVKVYFTRLYDYKAAHDVPYEQRFRDGWGKEEYYLLEAEKHFKDCGVNKSLLVDHLKEIQKK